MATYTKETALYDTGAIANDIQDAGTKASKFISSDSSGIMVYDGTDGVQYPSNPSANTNNVFIDDDSLDIRKGTQILASFGADGQSFNNDYSEPILEVGYLDTSTYATKLNWWEYNNENPYTVIFPWDVTAINSLRFYTEEHYEVQLSSSPTYSLNNREMTFSSETCVDMIANHVAYIAANYNAEGKFPYYTLGSDGVGNIGKYSARIGENVIASGTTSVAEGESTMAIGNNSHAEGYASRAGGMDSHAEGSKTYAGGLGSHAEGYWIIDSTDNVTHYTEAHGEASHAEGRGTAAYGAGSHAEGALTTADGITSHAEGYRNMATGYASHAEGSLTAADGIASHAEGYETVANGYASHAEGHKTNAKGYNSHASGEGTVASFRNQVAIGKWNEIDPSDDGSASPAGYGDYVVMIGNGADENSRSNSLTINDNGDVRTAGEIVVKNHSSPIGTTRSVNLTSNKSVANNTATALLSLELDAGTWLAIVGVRFPSNSTGYRKVNISTTSGANEAQYVVPPASGEVTQIVFPKLLTPTATTTYYLNVRHTSGTSLSMPGGATLWANYIQAIRIQ